MNHQQFEKAALVETERDDAALVILSLCDYGHFPKLEHYQEQLVDDVPELELGEEHQGKIINAPSCRIIFIVNKSDFTHERVCEIW